MANEDTTRITLANGVEYNGDIGEDGRGLAWAWLTDPVDNDGFLNLATAFSNPENTGAITCTYPGGSYVVEGYTWLTDIIIDPVTRHPSVRLRRNEE